MFWSGPHRCVHMRVCVNVRGLTKRMRWCAATSLCSYDNVVNIQGLTKRMRWCGPMSLCSLARIQRGVESQFGFSGPNRECSTTHVSFSLISVKYSGI